MDTVAHFSHKENYLHYMQKEPRSYIFFSNMKYFRRSQKSFKKIYILFQAREYDDFGNNKKQLSLIFQQFNMANIVFTVTTQDTKMNVSKLDKVSIVLGNYCFQLNSEKSIRAIGLSDTCFHGEAGEVIFITNSVEFVFKFHRNCRIAAKAVSAETN